MARGFNGSSQYLYVADDPAFDVSYLTVAGWCYTGATKYQFMASRDGGGSARHWVIGTTSTGKYYGVVWNTAGTIAEAISTTSYSTGVWFHLALTYDGSNCRLYANGTQVATTALAGTLRTGARQIEVGTQLAYSNYWNGRLAEVAVWSAALAADEIAALAKALAPACVRPQSLVSYWPLWGQATAEPDLVGGHALTNSGSTQADHPRVVHPVRPQMVYVPAAAGGGFQAAWARGCNVLLQPGVMG